MSTLEATLGISGISIVLLFAAMAVIWGLMAVMARIPEKKSQKAEMAEETPVLAAAPVISNVNKAKAAVLAVAAALALSKRSTRLAPRPSSISTTPWQAAQRANQISRRNQVKSHK